MIARFFGGSLFISSAALVAIAGLAPTAAKADVLVATIYGVYDANSCGDTPSSCLTAPAGEPLASGYMNNLAGAPYSSYDTPSLYINNNTPYPFTDVQIVLTAYQGLNKGSTTTVPTSELNGGTVPADTVYQLVWDQVGGGYGNTVPGTLPNTSANLFSYDYDDYYFTGVLESPICAPEGLLIARNSAILT
jgi:hypothetical protein